MEGLTRQNERIVVVRKWAEPVEGIAVNWQEDVLDLPDAEHIHLHRRPDGTWSAVPMRQTRDGNMPLADAVAWVDVPAAPEACFHDICDGEPECLLPADPEDGAR